MTCTVVGTRRARYVTPDLSNATTGREGESSARITINGMGKKSDTKSRTAFQTSCTNKQLQQCSGGIPIQDHTP